MLRKARKWVDLQIQIPAHCEEKKEMSYFTQLKIWIGLVLEWSDYALAIALKIRRTTFGIAEEKVFFF